MGKQWAWRGSECTTGSFHVLDALLLLQELLLYHSWHVVPQLCLKEMARLCYVFDPVVLWQREHLVPIDRFLDARKINCTCFQAYFRQ